MRYSSQRLHSRTALPVSALICIASVAAYAQQTAPATPSAPAATPAPTAAAAPGSLSSSLGVIVFPAKDQSSGQQSTDEQACYGWAKSKTGIDPAHITAPQPDPNAQAANSGGGERARGAARGAAGGALVGAVAGDAGTGAAVGATVGAISGGAAKRRAKKDAAAQQEQQAQAAIAQQHATYNKAFSACMEGKGYTVK